MMMKTQARRLVATMMMSEEGKSPSKTMSRIRISKTKMMEASKSTTPSKKKKLVSSLDGPAWQAVS